jgi:hypothetical protein
LVPTLLWNFPCNEWPTNAKDTCTSWYTDGSTGLPYLQGTTCKSQWDDGYTPEGGNTCVQCDSTWLTCSTTSKTQCLTCNSTGTYKYFYSTNNQCLSSCESGTYTSALKCVDCVTPWATCTSATVWESCLQSITNK